MTEHEFVAKVYTTYDVPSAEVSLDDDGDVVFDWHLSADRVLSVFISDQGQLGWAGIFDGISQHGEEWNSDLDAMLQRIEQAT